DLVVLLDLRSLCSCGHLNHLRRERNNLHEVLVAQLARYWSKNACADRRAVFFDQHRGILIEPHVRAVSAAHFLTRTHNHRILNGSLFNRAVGRGLFDRHLDSISQAGNLSGGAANRHNHLHPTRPRIVSNLQGGLHLDHLSLPPALAAKPTSLLSELSQLHANAYAPTLDAFPQSAPYRQLSHPARHGP